jgi:hypothetical protein
MNDVKKGVAAGVFSGLVATACCWPVIALILLGLSGVASSLSFLGTYTTELRILSLVLFIGSLYFFIKRKHGVCNRKTIQQNKVLLIVAAAVYIILIILISYVLLPLLAR